MHPGYGFLAENPEFAEACAKAGLTFIGPDAAGDARDGQQDERARQVAMCRRACLVALPASSDTSLEPRTVGYPLLVKAVAGGGGKGMRVVRAAAELASAVRLARSEARSSFGDDRVYFERLLERPRHIEVQLLGDKHGTVVPFVERECSIQRRHQKLIEETPSPAVTPELRERLMAAAAAIGRAADYTSAGTIEFLVDADGEFYFLEMNTRLQVEHPVTEAVTGVDFVRAQIEIARGARLADLHVAPKWRRRTSALSMPTVTVGQRACDRGARLRGEPGRGISSVAWADHAPARAVGSRHSGRQRRLRRLDGADSVRPADLEGRRVGARPPGSHRADGSRID